ncbi:hypothetical protein HYDPIDRAFT_171683, partial [Hydnomerulius pinastri MD-312]
MATWQEFPEFDEVRQFLRETTSSTSTTTLETEEQATQSIFWHTLVTMASKPKRKRAISVRTPEVEDDNQHTSQTNDANGSKPPDSDDDNPPDDVSLRRYSTRNKKIDLERLGLKKMSQSEIAAKAQRKRAKKAGMEAQKEALNSEKLRREAAGAKRLKELETRKLQEENSGDEAEPVGDEGEIDWVQTSSEFENEEDDSVMTSDMSDVSQPARKGEKSNTKLTVTEKKRLRAQALRASVSTGSKSNSKPRTMSNS